MDNTTSCSYIKNFGGKTPDLDELARDIWLWCLKRRIHLSVAHVPGKDNVEADALSRDSKDDLEWSLLEDVFIKINKKYPDLEVDLFASRLNHKLDKYVSYRAEPGAFAIDAFTLDWIDRIYYIFPPFSLIARVLQKVEKDGAEVVLVAPIWTTQPWWAVLTRLISGACYKLPTPRRCLQLPHNPEKLHPMTKMKLGVFRLSGNHLRVREHQQKLLTSSCRNGVNQLKNSTNHILTDGFLFVGTRLIPFGQL